MIFRPGSAESSSTVLSVFFSDPVATSKPPILPPSNKTFEPVICPDDFNNKPLELISEDVNTNPPILPPVKSTDEPVISPVDFTLNGALPLAFRDAAPPKNLVSPIDDKPVNFPPVDLCIESDPIIQFAINPALAVNTPSITAPLAINVPLDDTAKFEPNLTKNGFVFSGVKSM